MKKLLKWLGIISKSKTELELELEDAVKHREWIRDNKEYIMDAYFGDRYWKLNAYNQAFISAYEKELKIRAKLINNKYENNTKNT